MATCYRAQAMNIPPKSARPLNRVLTTHSLTCEEPSTMNIFLTPYIWWIVHLRKYSASAIVRQKFFFSNNVVLEYGFKEMRTMLSTVVHNFI